MEMVLYIVVGFVLLWRGGDLLVDGADALARSHGVPPTIAGVFILGFGTSAPELAVTLLAALDGNAGIAVGNVVGSNIANVALVLGAAALLIVLRVDRHLFKIEMPVGIAASVLAWFLLADGQVTRMDGLILLAGFGIYAALALTTAKHRDAHEGERPAKRLWFDAGKSVLALAAVIGGAELFKNGAVQMAEALGVSEVVIGSTLVAFATSLPEFATAIAAARARQADLVVGNVIGSNIFNLLLVLGVAGTVVDQRVDPSVPYVLMPILLGVAVLAFAIAALRGRKIGRPAGILFVSIYVGFIVYSVIVAR